MERRLELLEFLSTLINTTKENIVIMNKETLQSMITCLQVTQTKIIILQEQSHLLNDELIELKSQQQMKFSELVFVQNNPLYDDEEDDDDVFYQHSMHEKLKKQL